MKHLPLSYRTDGSRVFVDVIEYRSKEKLTQLKNRQQLYVRLSRTSMQSYYASAKEEHMHLRIWVTWINIMILGQSKIELKLSLTLGPQAPPLIVKNSPPPPPSLPSLPGFLQGSSTI